jgi:hypothetical protein
MTAALFNGIAEGAARNEGSGLGDRRADVVRLANEFDPSQPRDEHGMWTETGNGGMSWTTKSGTKMELNGEMITATTAKGQKSATYMGPLEQIPPKRAAELTRIGLNPDEHLIVGTGPIMVSKDQSAPFVEARRRVVEIEKAREARLAQAKADQAAKDKSYLDRMKADADELRKKIPSDHVPVSVKEVGDADGHPILSYEAQGTKLSWQDVTHHGTASAIRPGALGAFAHERVASIPRDKLIGLQTQRAADEASTALATVKTHAERAAKFSEAKLLGKPVLLKSYTENGRSNEGGEWGDYQFAVSEHAMPDGTVSKTKVNLR